MSTSLKYKIKIIHDLEEKISQCHKEIKEYKKAIEEEQQKTESLQIQIIKLESDNNYFTNIINDYETEYDNITNSVIKYRDIKELAEKNNKKLEEKLVKLQEDNCKLMTKLMLLTMQ